jgi:hypothetical protein
MHTQDTGTSIHALTIDMSSGETLIPLPAVAREFGVDPRTLRRWLKDDAMAFPAPLRINNRLYFQRRPLESWKIARATGKKSEAA